MFLREPRYVTRLQARLHLPEDQLLVAIDDVSLRGAFVHTTERLPLRAVVDLRVSLPDGRELGFASQVAHCLTPDAAEQTGRRSGLGLYFMGGSDPAKAAWIEHVRTLMDRERVHTQRGRVLLLGTTVALMKRIVGVLEAATETVVPAEPGSLHRLLGPQTPWDVLVIEDTLDDAMIEQLALVLPTLVVLRTDDAARKLHALELGAADVLTRPFASSYLLQKVRRFTHARASVTES